MEIERKYLVNRESWEQIRHKAVKTSIRQGYLSTDPGRTIRIRISGDKAWLTIKGATRGISRSEFEYEIPLDEGLQLMEMVKTPLVEKNRYVIDYNNFTWEVDEFFGDNEGLLIAEVELESESDQPELPDWIGEEVTPDRRYSNLNLALNPYQKWPV